MEKGELFQMVSLEGSGFVSLLTKAGLLNWVSGCWGG